MSASQSSVPTPHDCKRHCPAEADGHRTSEGHSASPRADTDKGYRHAKQNGRQGYQPQSAKSLYYLLASMRAGTITRRRPKSSFESYRRYNAYSSEHEAKHTRTDAT